MTSLLGGAKETSTPWVQAKTIVCQIFIDLLLTMELGGFWIEVHLDPSMMESSLLLPFAAAEPPTAPNFSPFFIAIEMKKVIEIREPDDQKKARKKKKMQGFGGKCPKSRVFPS